MFTSMTVSERAPSASSVSPAPMLALSPARESRPTIKKSSSPYCPFASRMSSECGSSALIVLSRAFFDVLHCQAPPVITSASTAASAATERPASSIGRRRLGSSAAVSTAPDGGSSGSSSFG